MLPGVYMPLLLALAKYLCKITNFYYFDLLTGNFDGAVAVSIHDFVIEIFHWHNPSGKKYCLRVESTSKRIKYKCFQKM